MRRHVWGLIAVLVVATAIYYPFSPGGRQRRNMTLAEQHIAVLQPRFNVDSRFADIALYPYTGSDGALMVVGEVATQADVEALRQIVDASNPPCPIAFRVYLGPATSPARSTR